MKYLLLFLFIITHNLSFAQDMTPDSGYVNIHADPRLELILNKPPSKTKKYKPTKARGFRVQIYNGYDRQKATEVKVDFMRQFPGVRAYLTYNNPQFRVRVGDFTSRKEASELFYRINSQFTTSMIVPDVINLDSIRKKSDND